MSPFRTRILPLLIMLVLLCSCRHQRQSLTNTQPLRQPLMQQPQKSQKRQEPQQPQRPQQLKSDALPRFTDDGDRQALLACARTHRAYLASLPADYQTTIEGTTYPLSWLQLSMDEFIALLESTPDHLEIADHITENFTAFQAAGRQGERTKDMLVTGYYEPLFAGSLERKGSYIYPLYTVPRSLVSGPNPRTGKKTVGRMSRSNTIVPFWTRAEIEKSQHLSGEELAYLKDPFDAFLLHVQGSGRILLPDGSQRSVRFAGHNGHAYKSIGKLLVDEGKLTLEETSIPTIRRYFDEHPDEQQRILHYNPRFIFFSWGDDLPPRGSLGRPLTPGRSIAIDRKALPDTLFGWLETSIPVTDADGNIISWQPAHRFVLPQDSGAAILGTGRVDIFWGHGAYAETAAGNMKEKGQLYFFIKKGYTGK